MTIYPTEIADSVVSLLRNAVVSPQCMNMIHQCSAHNIIWCVEHCEQMKLYSIKFSVVFFVVCCCFVCSSVRRLSPNHERNICRAPTKLCLLDTWHMIVRYCCLCRLRGGMSVRRANVAVVICLFLLLLLFFFLCSFLPFYFVYVIGERIHKSSTGNTQRAASRHSWHWHQSAYMMHCSCCYASQRGRKISFFFRTKLCFEFDIQTVLWPAKVASSLSLSLTLSLSRFLLRALTSIPTLTLRCHVLGNTHTHT